MASPSLNTNRRARFVDLPMVATRFGRAAAAVVGFDMAAKVHLLRALGAMLLIAGCFAPAAANAHAGHAHRAHPAPVATAVAPPAMAVGTGTCRQAEAGVPAGSRPELARRTPTATRIPLSGCVSHCCSGIAGHACCAAALVPEMTFLDLSRSPRFLTSCTQTLLGLVPEALPKPPRPIG